MSYDIWLCPIQERTMKGVGGLGSVSSGNVLFERLRGLLARVSIPATASTPALIAALPLILELKQHHVSDDIFVAAGRADGVVNRDEW